MQIKFETGHCIVTKEDGDVRYYNDSRLFYAIKKKLISMGFDVIKKRMWRDGHLVSDHQQYIRSRNYKHPKAFWMYWGSEAIRSAYEDFNQGEVTLVYGRINE